MESLKKFLELGRQHYEKLLLSLVLIGLGGAVYYLSMASQEEKTKIEDYMKKQVRRTVKGVAVVDLTPFEQIRQRLENPPTINLSTPHNLFNPVKWQKRPDGSFFKIQSGKEIGPYAVKITAIRPLYLTLHVDRPAGTGWWMTLTNQTIKRGYRGYRDPQFVTVGKTNIRTFVLTEVKPPEDPTEWVVEFKDTGEKVTITREQPYQRVEGYEADLEYDVEGKTFKNVLPGQRIRLSGEDYIIVAINAKEVLLSAVSNDRRFAIQYTDAP